MSDNQIINQNKQTDIQAENQTEIEPKTQLNSTLTSTSKKPRKNVHLKFASPLKVLDIDSKREYIKRVLSAIGIGIAQISIGATLMTIFLYSSRTGDRHAIICCLAYHFFSVEAILTFNHSNGWSKPLRLRHKRCLHIFLQLCAIVFSTIGTLLFIPSEDIRMSPHAVTGYLSIALAVITLVIGPLAFYGSYRQTLVHAFLGIMTLMMSSISFCLGMLTPTFKNYVNSSTILYIVISFITFYTVLIIIMCIIKHVTR